MTIEPTANPCHPPLTARGARRFTIIEVVVATTFTGIAIAAAVGLLATVLWGTNYARHRMAASNIAANRLEELRSIPYATLPYMEEERVAVNPHGVRDGDGQYQRTTTLGSDYLSTRPVTVSVQAKWKHNMPPLNVTVTTILGHENLLER